MPGYQVGETCYPSAGAAAAAFVAQQPWTVQTIGSSCTGVARIGISGTDAAPVLNYSWTRLSGSCTVPATTSLSYVPQACRLVQMDDAATMSWAVVLAWVCVFAVKQLIRIVRDR